MRTNLRDSIGFGRQPTWSRRRRVAGLAVAGVLAVGIVTAGCSGSGTKTATSVNFATPAAVSAAIASATPVISPTPVVSSTPATAATPKPANKKKKQAAAGDGAAAATPQPGAASPTPDAANNGKSDRRAQLKSALQQVDASTVVAGFQKRGLPVGNSTVLNPTTDPDGQLGKPGQYTSKVTFADSRIATNGAIGIAAGGAVEVFSTMVDATRRKQELTRAASANGTVSEFDFQRGTIVLRLSPRLAADQVSEYESTVNLVLKAVSKRAAKHSAPATATATPSPMGGLPSTAVTATPSPAGR